MEKSVMGPHVLQTLDAIQELVYLPFANLVIQVQLQEVEMVKYVMRNLVLTIMTACPIHAPMESV